MSTSTKARAARKPGTDAGGSRLSSPAPFTFAHSSVPHEKHPDQNEDTVLVDRERGLAAVFDGVGSGPGHIASSLAARVIRRGWREALRESTFIERNVGELLQSLLLDAHAQIRVIGEQLAAEAQKKTSRPGTTAVVAAFHNPVPDQPEYTLSYAHVGDSRIYLLRLHALLQRLTQDDGYLSLKLKEGLITEDDALRIDQATSADQLSAKELEYFERRNGITQALGSDKQLTVHIGSVSILPGDRVLLCSDGIHDNLTDSELAELLSFTARTTVAKKIVLRAIERSHEESERVIRAKFDDMSAVVVTYNLSGHDAQQ